MQSFEFKCPTEIVFGKDAEAKIAEKVKSYGASRVFIIYGGGSVVRSGLLARVENLLKDADIAVETIGGVQPNPRLSLVREAIKNALAFKADFILAVGGGSVIDTAKAVAHGVANPDTDVWDFWSGKTPLTKTTKLGVILTIPAAGSETSDSAVITNEEIGKKGGLNTPFNRPTVSFMNPELAYTLPKKSLVQGACDILMHTMERYFTPIKGNPFTDLIAEAVIKTVIASVRVAVVDQKNYDAMSEIMWCGSVSHSNVTEWGRKKDFACHKLGHEIGGKFDSTHGDTLTAIWGSWAEFVYQDDPARFAHFAEKIWDITAGTDEERARAGIRKTVEFFKELGMPTNFTELGIGVQSEETIRDLANRCTNNGAMKVGCFHPIGFEEAVKIYSMANK